MDITINGERIRVERITYAGSNLGLQLWADDGPYARPTVNPAEKLDDGVVAVKAYNESEDMVNLLAKAGVVAPLFDEHGDMRFVLAGYGIAYLCKLLL